MTRVRGPRKKFAVYSINDDLKSNNAALRKLKVNGGDDNQFMFEPDKVQRLDQLWKREDY